MIAIGPLFVGMLCDCSKSRRRLEAEILILRHQLNILRRSAPPRGVRWLDRALFIWLWNAGRKSWRLRPKQKWEEEGGNKVIIVRL